MFTLYHSILIHLNLGNEEKLDKENSEVIGVDDGMILSLI